MAGAKNTAICHLMQHFYGPPLYISSIVAFKWTTTINLVFAMYYNDELMEHHNMYVLAALYLAIMAPHKPATIAKI